MSESCKGEVHYVDGLGVDRVDHVFNFQFPVRSREESVEDFKRRVTQIVLRASRISVGREIVSVKWAGPLGYHQGYLDIPVVHKIKRIELPQL